jgi:predicted  nucleic acid-binding Zn-ribbon protein
MSDDPTKHLPRTTDEMLGEILNRLERLETAFDQRLKQTTPLSAQLAEMREQMETGFRESNERHDRMERDFGERQDRTEKELREINRTLRRMNVDLATALRDQDELGDRVTALETQTSQP